MQFLNPAFLLGLAAAAIPIVLHFLSRRRPITVPFAPLRFLLPTQEKQMRRLNLRRLLLMAMRVAILACLAIGMARPTLTAGIAGLVRSGEGVSAVVLVDASASMAAQQSGGTVFDRARQEAAGIAQGLDDGDELLLGLFHDDVEPLFREFLRERSLLVNELGSRAARPRGTDYLAAIEEGLELLQRGTAAHRELYLVSDFARAPIDSARLSAFLRGLEGTPPTQVFLRDVPVEPFANREVTAVERPATLLRSGQSAEVAVLARQDGEEEQLASLFLDVGGVTVGETELRLAPGGQERHVFPLSLPEAGDLGGSARLRPDRYPLDDERWFVLTVEEQVPALVLRGLRTDEGERDPLLFLLAALDPAGGSGGAFALEVGAADRFDPAALARAHLLVGVDLVDIGAARLASLVDYLEAGGTALLFAGDPRVAQYHDESLLPALGPLRLGEFRGAEDARERLELAAPDHPVFAGFDEEELATLEEVRLRNFYRLTEDHGTVLLRYAGGGAALSEFAVGEGRVILAGFHTAATSSDLPWSPMFLPLAQRLAGYLATAGWSRFGRQFDSGMPVSVEAPAGAAAEEGWALVAEAGDELPARLDASVNPPRVRAEADPEPGLYRFTRGGEAFATVAVNVPVSESVRDFPGSAWLEQAIGDESPLRLRRLRGEEPGQAMVEARRGVPVHQWFFLAAFLLMVAESLLSRRIAPVRPAGA